MNLTLSGRVFITGGAGFLARGIYRRAFAKIGEQPWDASFTCYSRDDAKHAALQTRYPQVHCFRGDVAYDDIHRLAELMRGHETVIHAGAEKHVDRSEFEGLMTAQTNVVGSMNVMRAAILAGVQTVIGISTDKACAPANTYGLTKSLMERIFADAALRGGPRFICVRYGNVVASSGSVIPVFRRQLQTQGYVTITDARMTRFWMTVDDAVDAICNALAYCGRGDVFVPNPRAASVREVAEAVAEQCGVPFASSYTGIRPGEKLHEQLISEPESPRARVADIAGRGFLGWLLGPPGKTTTESEPWNLSSGDAERVTTRWLIDAIEDSEYV